MKILIAEDESAFRHLLEDILVKWGYEVVIARDGDEAWQALMANDAPRLAILDWLMPGIDGVEICRKVRQEMPLPYTYLILLTSQHKDEDLITGMDAGADDYIFKPLKMDELRVRLNAGKRMLVLQNELAAHAADLEAANRDLESFSYTVANDLLKSLLSIAENAKSICDQYCDKKDEMCGTYTSRIYNKTKDLAQLIGVMLEFFRPMRRELHPAAIDLSAIAGEEANKLRQRKPERRLAFRIPEGITAIGDGDMLREVIGRLLDNAWKHTMHCAEAVIEFGMTEVEGRSAYFVRDNGTGFEKKDMDKLFKPFRPLPGTEESAGEGISLATVERIIRRHGGRVWAEGEPDKGATFWFTLPTSPPTAVGDDPHRSRQGVSCRP